MQAFVGARYEYHWAPLLGCLVGQLEQLGAPQPSSVVGSTTGISYQPPQDAVLPTHLQDGLDALGVAAQVTDHSHPNRLRRYLARRRIRYELREDRAITAYGVGVSPFGQAWGLIVGCDDERRAWRREGPMTEQVSPWLTEASFDASPVLLLIAARRIGDPDPDAFGEVAERALRGALQRIHADLAERIEILDSSVEVEPQRYAHDAQALAANWGEATAFWRGQGHPVLTSLTQDLAVTMSRYATLFPYPMGGQPNHPGVRRAAVQILQAAVDIVADMVEPTH